MFSPYDHLVTTKHYYQQQHKMLLHFWTHWPIIFCSGNRDHPFDSTQQQSNCLSMKGNELRELWISFTRLQNAKLTYEGNNKAFWHVVLKSLFKLAQSIIYSEMSKKLLLSKTIEYPSTMFLHTLGFPFNKTKEKSSKSLHSIKMTQEMLSLT